MIRKLGDSKIITTFATQLRKTIAQTYWRDGRVVDCGGLENR